MKIRDLQVPLPRPQQVLVPCRHAIRPELCRHSCSMGSVSGNPKAPVCPVLSLQVKSSPSGLRSCGFRGGERVMGYSRLGSHAEYVVVDERLVALIPETLGFEQAAAFPVASMTAYHGLVTLAGVQNGDRLLVHARGWWCWNSYRPAGQTSRSRGLCNRRLCREVACCRESRSASSH